MKLTKANVTRVLQKAGFAKVTGQFPTEVGFCYGYETKTIIVEWQPNWFQSPAGRAAQATEYADAMRPILERYWSVKDAKRGIGLELFEKGQ